MTETLRQTLKLGLEWEQIYFEKRGEMKAKGNYEEGWRCNKNLLKN